MKSPKPSSGYAYKLTGKSAWDKAKNDSWEIVVLSSADTAKAAYAGKRQIDGVLCAVFKLGTKYIAQKV